MEKLQPSSTVWARTVCNVSWEFQLKIAAKPVPRRVPKRKKPAPEKSEEEKMELEKAPKT